MKVAQEQMIKSNLCQDGFANVKTEVLSIVWPGATVEIENQVVLTLPPSWQPFQPEKVINLTKV